MNKTKKYTLIIITVMMLTFSLGLAIGAGKQWYETTNLPSAKIDTVTLDKLVQEEKVTTWFSNSVWKDGNCYYYDLTLSNSTNVTWYDPRREITCKPGITASEVNELQLDNIQWTISQMSPKVEVKENIVTSQNIGEDLKTKKPISAKTKAMISGIEEAKVVE